MSSENGVPMDVCIYCGAEIITHSQNCKHGECGTRYSYGVTTQSDICKQIVQLKEENAEKDHRIAELEAECVWLNIENKRIRKTAGNMFDSGVAFSVWNRFDGGIHRPFNKEEALKHNGLGE